MPLQKFKANELHSLSSTSQKYFLNFFSPNLPFTWKDVYTLPRIVTINTRLRVFHYKVLNNALYLNKHLYIFKLSETNLCFFFVIKKMKQLFICLLTALKVKLYGKA